MLSWLAKKLIEHNMARIREGDIGPTLRLDAQDIRFRFPGDSSWATELESKDELQKWLERFVDAGLQIYPDEVVLKGFPWRQTICIRGRANNSQIHSGIRQAAPAPKVKATNDRPWIAGRFSDSTE